jgi:glucokinase
MYLGIEIGGTKLQLGIGPGDGTLAALWRGPVTPAEGADGIRKQITQAVPELLANAKRRREDLRGIGIGFGGPVDDRTRTVIKSHQIAGWDEFPLADWISEMVGLPAVLGNDADVAGLAEALFGAGKGYSPVFYITIGSGIGGGLIIDGEIYRGVGRGAAEIGHLRVPHDPFACRGALGTYTVEGAASGWALAHAHEIYARYQHEHDPPLYIPGSDKSTFNTKDLAEASEEGNLLACGILSAAWDSLAEGIVHVITLLCPRRIVIGGGVALMSEQLLFEPLRHKVAERVFKPFAGCYEIVPAALGEEVVVHGALALAYKRFGG